ncbi:MAG: hypothetical protein WCJ07_05765, partial [Verrucomicrobiota bacterium]
MKNLFLLTAVSFLLNACLSPLSIAHAQGTAFTYQGRLNDANGPATGIYDLQFGIYDAASNGSAVGSGAVTNAAVPVTNGLFTVTLDFGYGVFDGTARWLEIGVQPAGGTNFATLTPRQNITPAPYAIAAASAITVSGTVNASQVSGSIPAANIAGTLAANQLPTGVVTNNASGVTLNGTFGGDGGMLYNLNASALNGTISLMHLPMGLLINGASGVTLSGTFSGNGSGLTNLNAAQLNGALSPAQLPAGVVTNAGTGVASIALGSNAQATNDNSFVWSDGANGAFTSTTNNQFSVQASGGVRLVTGGAGMTVDGQPVL